MTIGKANHPMPLTSKPKIKTMRTRLQDTSSRQARKVAKQAETFSKRHVIAEKALCFATCLLASTRGALRAAHGEEKQRRWAPIVTSG